jgi:hypothetical protein
MGASVWQRVLGDRFDALDPGLRVYFARPGAGLRGEGSGVYDEAGLRRRLLRPLLRLVAPAGVLFPEHGRDVAFTVTNTTDPDGTLRGRRTFAFPGRERVMVDAMTVEHGRLVDTLGHRGLLVVRLAVDVDGVGALVMRSDRLHLRLGRLRVPLPPVARLDLRESRDAVPRHGATVPDAESGPQRVEVTLCSPLVGVWFRYAGTFRYRLAAEPPVSTSDRPPAPSR